MLGEKKVAIFGTSIAKSRQQLMEEVWFSPPSGGGEPLIDEIIINSIRRGEDLTYIRNFVQSGGLQHHERINSIEKLASFLADLNGPSLTEAMMLNIGMLSKLNYNMAAVPLTETERQIKQMEDHFYNDDILKEVEKDVLPPPPEEEGGGHHEVGDFIWPCIFPQVAQNPHLYTWYRTVWYRVNVSFLYVSREKAMAYANAHLPQIRYLDSLMDPRDDLIDTNRLTYFPMKGAATMNANINYFKREVVWRKIRKTPLEHLCEAFPEKKWTIETLVSMPNCYDFLKNSTACYLDNDSWAPIRPDDAPVETHSIYRACVFLANQCRTTLSGRVEDMDALWTYYASFVEFFSYVSMCENPAVEASDTYLLTPLGSSVGRKGDAIYSGKLSPWEMYGTHLDVRTRHAGDLPDIFHLINTIPLAGEQCTPTTRLGKIYQKCLPFACQRRLIIDLIVETINTDDAFWELCSQLFWVMLAGLYPGDDRSELTMRDLMRAKELTQNKETFITALNPPPLAPCQNGGPLVVFTAFRLHIIYMASFNPTYVECARECIDWDHFVENTRESAQLIRSSDLIPNDPFERARTKMIKTIKNSNARVSRIRRRSLAVTLTKETNEVLEKLIFKDYFEKRSGVSNSSPPLRGGEELLYYTHILSPTCKGSIANFLLRLPPQERFTYNAYSILTLEEYGGVTLNTVDLMHALTTVYFTSKGMPKDFARVIDQFGVRDFVIACYYFNIATELERISFIPLDATTVERTDAAMVSRKRYNLYPGQAIPSDAYNVHIALCCGRICTLMGQGKFGAKAVAFDMEKGCYVCSRGKLSHKKNKIVVSPPFGGGNDNPDDFDDEEFDEDGGEDVFADIVEAQNDHIESVDQLLLGGLDLVSDSVKQDGRGTKRSKEMNDRKAIRTERKRFNRIPCGQPILTINLRGRALIWGNTGEKQKQYMFCPECGAFHVYSIFNFSGAINGLYRCNECAAKEVGHKEYHCCAYCKKDATDIVNDMYFCKNHYLTAKKWSGRCINNNMLLSVIAKIELKRK